METELKELLTRYLDQATDEEKSSFVRSYRSLERFYLDEILMEHNDTLSPIFEDASVLLEDAVIEVGLEANAIYYPRLTDELEAKHREFEKRQKVSEVNVPIG